AKFTRQSNRSNLRTDLHSGCIHKQSSGKSIGHSIGGQAMKIGIVGAGNVGGALGKGWAKKGHEVMFGVRNASDPEVNALLKQAGANARAGSVAEAAKFGEIVVFATPWPATQEAVRNAGNLSGKVFSIARIP